MFSPFCRGITSEIVAKPLNCLTMRMLGVVEEEKQQPTENETKTRKSITDTSMYTIVEQGEITPQKQRGKKKHERPIYEPNPTDAYKSCTVSEKAGPSLTHEYQECKSLPFRRRRRCYYRCCCQAREAVLLLLPQSLLVK
jgi:hypothetical protein